jgi:hypothetical protein
VGPGPVIHNGVLVTGQVRVDWTASWTGADGIVGELVHGENLTEVLLIFPAQIAAQFEAAIAP